MFFYKDYFNKLIILWHYLYIEGFMRMKKLNFSWLLLPLIMLSGCVNYENETPVYRILPYQDDMIGLQNLETRIIVYCYNSATITTEQCAREFENRGYVRLTDIPRLPAEYDYLKSDTYPTRRWRRDEKIPRW